MAGFEEFLAGKGKVMGESSRISIEDFPPLSKRATRQAPSVQNQGRPPSSSDCQVPAADLGTDAQPTWRSLFFSDPSPSLQYSVPIVSNGKPLSEFLMQFIQRGWLFGMIVLLGSFMGLLHNCM